MPALVSVVALFCALCLTGAYPTAAATADGVIFSATDGRIVALWEFSDIPDGGYDGYEVFVNDEFLTSSAQKSADITDSLSRLGTHKVRIIPVYNGNLLTDKSIESVYMHSVPIASPENLRYSDGILSWSAVKYADSYTVVINGITVAELTPSELSPLDISRYIADGFNYTVAVSAVSDSEYCPNKTAAASLTFSNFTAPRAVENIFVYYNGTVFTAVWSPVNADKYGYSLRSSKDNAVISSGYATDARLTLGEVLPDGDYVLSACAVRNEINGASSEIAFNITDGSVTIKQSVGIKRTADARTSIGERQSITPFQSPS